ncbi:MAG: hypothetical protein PSV16_09920 [Flavobacterium sp.]|nr:hypothetical protein [Flavobacterium sp.]
MNDLTYTAEKVNFDSNAKTITVGLKIPIEDSQNPYQFYHTFDLSTSMFGMPVNAIFCHIKKRDDIGTRLMSTTFNYDLTIDISSLDGKFDFSQDECLFILHHDNKFQVSDVAAIEKVIGNLYAAASKDPFSIDIDQIIDPKRLIPRRVGVSIVK